MGGSARLPLILFLMVATSMNSGCISYEQTPTTQQNGAGLMRNMSGRMRNSTSSQNQQMFEKMRQDAIAACQDKSEGEPCSMQTQRGNATGTCQTQEGTRLCAVGNWQGSLHNRTYNSS